MREQHGRYGELTLALAVYQRAERYDRAATLAESLLGYRARPNSPRELLAAAYPIAYPEQVASSSSRAGLDPYFLLAIMRRESLFRPDTRSAAGAVGLLQLLPATARRASIVLGRSIPADADMANPAVAISAPGTSPSWSAGSAIPPSRPRPITPDRVSPPRGRSRARVSRSTNGWNRSRIARRAAT